MTEDQLLQAIQSRAARISVGASTWAGSVRRQERGSTGISTRQPSPFVTPCHAVHDTGGSPERC